MRSTAPLFAPRILALTLLAFSLLLPARLAHADDPPAPTALWSAADPRIAIEVREGKPLVTLVVVPLCDNALINCGSDIAGRPRDLAHNIYWGAVFGQRRFFERKNSGWERVELTQGGRGGLLERAIYRRRVSRVPWGGAEGETTEQLVILEAIDGTAIDAAVERFYRVATEGGRARFQDGAELRDVRIQVAGYAGHNRLMDGVTLPPLSNAPGRAAVPSFVMACVSASYFTPALQKAGSTPLVMTRTLMAPEGYLIEAIARGLGDDLPRASLRERAVAAYAQWQRLSHEGASNTFAR